MFLFRPLPASASDLRLWLDSSSPRSVVLVSFGSWLSVEHLPRTAQEAMLETARAMAQHRFIIKRKWGTDTDDVWKKVPENVIVREWY